MTELQSILALGMEFTVEFFFVQAKTSESFECKEISTFGDGVLDLFRGEDEVKKIMNEAVRAKYEMVKVIIGNYEYAKNLKCTMYYVTPGKYVEDDNLLSVKNRIHESIKHLGIFEDDNIQLFLCDKSYIRKEYEKTKVQNSATFVLNTKIEIPYMDKVEESYFAIMPIKEYLQIVLDESNRIRSGVFELNVRDFAGIEENRVNQDIMHTIEAADKTKFGLLNNGITIVGNSLSKGQGKYTIKNFYVVNGCQTTNVLAQNIDSISDDMWISLKIVITQNDDIIRDIVQATNNQTEVEKIQLLSMDEYQQELESYYNSYDKYTRLFYERRSGQYRNNPEVEAIKIINPENQMKCFASVFLQLPHIASRFSGKLQDEISKRIFVRDHRPIMYYTSALVNYHMEKAFNNDILDQSYYKFKYHLQSLIAHIVWMGVKKPYNNSHKMDEYCEVLIKKINDHQTFIELLLSAKECIDAVVHNINDPETNKIVSIVNAMLLYSEIQWTDKDLRRATYFEKVVDDYLIPFKNMSIDGDLRYNFTKNLNYLKKITQDRRVVSCLISNDFFNRFKYEAIDEDRQLRITSSKEICYEYGRARKELREKIAVASKYGKEIE